MSDKKFEHKGAAILEANLIKDNGESKEAYVAKNSKLPASVYL